MTEQLQVGDHCNLHLQFAGLAAGTHATSRRVSRGDVANGTSATAETIVLVESPAKAKKIQTFLGTAFEVQPMHGLQQGICTEVITAVLTRLMQVIASYGHVRDLPAKDGSVDPARDFQMQWAVLPSAHTRIKAIRSSLGNAKSLVLATDPDREGEAIAWHLQQELEVLQLAGCFWACQIVCHSQRSDPAAHSHICLLHAGKACSFWSFDRLAKR